MKKIYIIPNIRSVDIELDENLLLVESYTGGVGTGGIDTDSEGGDVEEVRGYTSSDLWENEW